MTAGYQAIRSLKGYKHNRDISPVVTDRLLDKVYVARNGWTIRRQLGTPKGEAKCLLTVYSALTFCNTLAITLAAAQRCKGWGHRLWGRVWCP
jgi:hypothetical protein